MTRVSNEQREFVTKLVVLAQQSNVPSTRKAEFLSKLVKLAGALGPPAAPAVGDLATFQTVIIENWDNIRWRLLGTTTDRMQGLAEPQRAILRILEEAPSLLGPLDDSRTETTHTRLIGWFVSREDAAGRYCRRSLMAYLGIGEPDRARVQTEVLVAAGCRVDVVVETPKSVAYIEAKVDAVERSAQLDDYDVVLRSVAAKQGLDPVLAFLTLDENDPSTSAAPHIHLTFRDLLRLWLPGTLLRGATGVYLGCYLATVARNLCRLSGAGPFERWSLQNKHRTLKLLSSIEENDVR